MARLESINTCLLCIVVLLLIVQVLGDYAEDAEREPASICGWDAEAITNLGREVTECRFLLDDLRLDADEALRLTRNRLTELSEDVAAGRYAEDRTGKRSEKIALQPTGKDNADEKEDESRIAGWFKYLDRNLTMCLVENGLTPFDKGVPEILNQIVPRLKAHKEEERSYLTELRKQFDSREKYFEVADPIIARFDEEKEGIIEEFRAKIRALRDTCCRRRISA